MRVFLLRSATTFFTAFFTRFLTRLFSFLETVGEIKQCRAAPQISVEVTDIKAKPLREGLKSALQGIFVVATLLPKASKMLRLVCNGQAGAHRYLFDLAEIGGIPSKGAYPPRSKVAKLPFNGAKCAPVAGGLGPLCAVCH